MDDYTKKLLRQYEEHKDDPRVFVGESVAAEGGGGIALGLQGGSMARYKTATGDVNWRDGELPRLVKRTPAQRTESLANRLWQSVKDHDPVATEMVLKLLYEDAWKRGMPISYDDVKNIAANLMRQAAAKAGGSY